MFVIFCILHTGITFSLSAEMALWYITIVYVNSVVWLVIVSNLTHLWEFGQLPWHRNVTCQQNTTWKIFFGKL